MSGKQVTRDLLEPKQAVQIARRALADFELNSDQSLAAYLPSQEVDDVEYEIGVLEQDDAIVAADWRTYGGSTTSETWGGGKAGRGELIGVARNYVVDEKQQLAQRKDSKNQIKRQSAELITRGAKAIAKQINFQRANAIANARVDIQGPGGMRETVTFGRRAEFDTTAPKLFTDQSTGTDPIAYLGVLCDMYEDENEFRPAEILISREAKLALLNHPNVAKLLGTLGERSRLTPGELDNVLSLYELPPLRTMSKAKTRLNDYSNPDNPQYVDKYNLPQDSVILTAGQGDPTDPLSSLFGRTFWGRTVSADLPEFGLTGGGTGAPGIVAAVYEEGWPYKREVIVDALTLPVVFNPNYTLKAKVI